MVEATDELREMLREFPRTLRRLRELRETLIENPPPLQILC